MDCEKDLYIVYVDFNLGEYVENGEECICGIFTDFQDAILCAEDYKKRFKEFLDDETLSFDDNPDYNFSLKEHLQMLDDENENYNIEDYEKTYKEGIVVSRLTNGMFPVQVRWLSYEGTIVYGGKE